MGLVSIKLVSRIVHRVLGCYADTDRSLAVCPLIEARPGEDDTNAATERHEGNRYDVIHLSNVFADMGMLAHASSLSRVRFAAHTTRALDSSGRMERPSHISENVQVGRFSAGRKSQGNDPV